ncbi:hypothetical protein C483_01014 [Natrialba hulunbeirensis JCM 10989]|uniref:Uncharacterized protein n=1 Tax=Natrialba hulunbeirensis JCM 10989 TaxID=1227493 RepID=M0ACT6_9EURY|nr:hypothetical protein [Natrialba hulunbeirensis]ELY95682.1 hypothetical protein C483_01014 [Natrialba hulunbeirensis JCM 10989]
MSDRSEPATGSDTDHDTEERTRDADEMAGGEATEDASREPPATDADAADVVDTATQPDGDAGTSRVAQLTDTARKSAAQSRLADVSAAFSRVESRATTVAKQSRIASIGATWKHYVEQSYCYRWLTAEPDPDVIVIDLRETWTVGPVIRVLDHVLARLDVALESSGLATRGRQGWATIRDRPVRIVSLLVLPLILISLLYSVQRDAAPSELVVVSALGVTALAAAGTRSQRSLDELVETRAGQWLIAAFEPPEPPETARRSDEQDSSEAGEAGAETERERTNGADGNTEIAGERQNDET